jgi:hypothetical protein
MDAKKMHTAREARVEAVIKDAPESVKGTLTQAFSGSASPRKAIKAQCLVCVGYDRESIKNCTGYSCPLWKYRPFQPDELVEMPT